MNRIKAITRLGSTKGSVIESGWLPLQKVFYLGKTANSVPLFPYGYHARPKKGFLSMIFTYGARSENRTHLVTSMDQRPTDLAEGEIVFYHPPTRSEIRLKANGEIHATTRLFKIVGDLDVSGATTLSASVKSNNKDISDTHTHVGSATAPTGAIAPTGVPN